MKHLLLFCLLAGLCGSSQAQVHVRTHHHNPQRIRITVKKPTPRPYRQEKVVVVRPQSHHHYYTHQNKHKHKSYHKKSKRHSSGYDRLTLHLGGMANYTYGLMGEPFTGYDAQLTNWHGNAFLGYRFDVRRKKKRGNLIGAWYNVGMHTSNNVDNLLRSQGIFQNVNPQANNEFREWEVGFIFREWFRLSAGSGQQSVMPVGSEKAVTYDYYTATTGLHLKFTKAIDITAGTSVLFGREFSQYALRPYVGANLTFDFLKK